MGRDIMVTVAKEAWLGWLAEGDLPGEESGEWALYYGSGSGRVPSPPKDLEAGARIYVVAFDFVRGYAPLLRIQETAAGFALVRAGGAVAVTPYDEHGEPLRVPGFRGPRYRTWARESERPFPNWMTSGLPDRLRDHVERLQELRKDPELRAELSRRALAGMGAQRIFNGLAR